ncbi:unnamed protein product [Prorocentrum cordatum]|uniref:Uncharacterized protein n=1 Tax=Prorocentrum cordatum TaxID=2364126 RepID=A0ABN9X779_9DINO|nr:unnamed protein product [Polarella glacialis]
MVSRRPTSGNSLCTAGSRRGPEGAPRAQRRVGLAARPRGPRPPSGPGRPPGAPSGPRAMPPRPASAREPTRRVCERPVADLEALEAALAECALSSSSTPDLPRGGPPSDLPCGGPPPGVPPLEGSLDLALQELVAAAVDLGDIRGRYLRGIPIGISIEISIDIPQRIPMEIPMGLAMTSPQARVHVGAGEPAWRKEAATTAGCAATLSSEDCKFSRAAEVDSAKWRAGAAEELRYWTKKQRMKRSSQNGHDDAKTANAAEPIHEPLKAEAARKTPVAAQPVADDAPVAKKPSAAGPPVLNAGAQPACGQPASHKDLVQRLADMGEGVLVALLNAASQAQSSKVGAATARIEESEHDHDSDGGTEEGEGTAKRKNTMKAMKAMETTKATQGKKGAVPQDKGWKVASRARENPGAKDKNWAASSGGQSDRWANVVTLLADEGADA